MHQPRLSAESPDQPQLYCKAWTAAKVDFRQFSMAAKTRDKVRIGYKTASLGSTDNVRQHHESRLVSVHPAVVLCSKPWIQAPRSPLAVLLTSDAAFFSSVYSDGPLRFSPRVARHSKVLARFLCILWPLPRYVDCRYLLTWNRAQRSKDTKRDLIRFQTIHPDGKSRPPV